MNPRLLAGLASVFLIFHFTAAALGSDRGQWGLAIAAIVVSATLFAERLLFSPPSIVRRGLGRPVWRGVAIAAVTGGALIAVAITVAWCAGWTLLWNRAVAPWLPGLFAQAGIAEETLFRAYLFGHLRQGRSFRDAALRSVVPFALVHVLLFWTMPWPIALMSVALAIVTSFPLAYLFELAGSTIWAPALLHFVIQGTVKVVTVSSDNGPAFALTWMIASAVIPLAVLTVPRRRSVPPWSI